MSRPKPASATPRLIRALLGAAGVLGGALGGLTYYASSQINPQPRRTYLDSYTFTPWELDVPYETLTLRTADGVNLHTWWMSRPDAQSNIICCHGHTGCKVDLLGISSGLWRAGHNVLLFDFRGRGESDPWPNTLAGYEVADLRAAVDWMHANGPALPLGVVSFSMGAAVAIMLAAQEPTIAALVADSPFVSSSDVVASTMRRRVPLVSRLLLRLTDALIVRQYGYSLHKVRPIDAIGRLAPRPLLLIHATNDTMIPMEHAHRMFAAAREPKELWICEGPEHCGTYFADRSGYVARVDHFLKQSLCSAR